MQRIIRCSHVGSHTYIKFLLIYIDLLCEAHGLFDYAIRLLNELYPIVKQAGNPHEKVLFAQSCIHAECGDAAIHYMYEFINQTVSTEDIIHLVSSFIPMMIEVHVPMAPIE